MRDLKEWAEDNGCWGRCVTCGQRTWIESGCAPVCIVCEAWWEPADVDDLASPGPDAETGEGQ